jgi:hypothetical protein
MCVGDNAEVITPGKVGRAIKVSELYDENRNPIDATSHPYMKFYMKVDFPMREGDILRAGDQ